MNQNKFSSYAESSPLTGAPNRREEIIKCEERNNRIDQWIEEENGALIEYIFIFLILLNSHCCSLDAWFRPVRSEDFLLANTFKIITRKRDLLFWGRSMVSMSARPWDAHSFASSCFSPQINETWLQTNPQLSLGWWYGFLASWFICQTSMFWCMFI